MYEMIRQRRYIYTIYCLQGYSTASILGHDLIDRIPERKRRGNGEGITAERLHRTTDPFIPFSSVSGGVTDFGPHFV